MTRVLIQEIIQANHKEYLRLRMADGSEVEVVAWFPVEGLRAPVELDLHLVIESACLAQAPTDGDPGLGAPDLPNTVWVEIQAVLSPNRLRATFRGTEWDVDLFQSETSIQAGQQIAVDGYLHAYDRDPFAEI